MKKFKNEIYIVRKNDTINSISKEYSVNPTKILIDNKITPDMIKEGVVLYINQKNITD